MMKMFGVVALVMLASHVVGCGSSNDSGSNNGSGNNNPKTINQAGFAGSCKTTTAGQTTCLEEYSGTESSMETACGVLGGGYSSAHCDSSGCVGTCTNVTAQKIDYYYQDATNSQADCSHTSGTTWSTNCD